MSGNDGDTVEPTTPTEKTEHQQRMELAKQFLEQQAQIQEDMRKQQAIIFQQLGLSMNEMENTTLEPQDEALDGHARKKRKIDEVYNGNEGSGSSLLLTEPQDGDGNLWDVRDELSNHPTTNEVEILGSNEGNGFGELSEQELEVQASSIYRDMLDQVQEELGDPLSSTLANACKRTFGQAVLDKKVKEKLDKLVKIPKNMTIMKTPKLNTEIYIRLRDVCRQKDEAAMNKQKDITRAVVPLLKALDEVSAAKSVMQNNVNQRNKDTHPPTKLEKDLFQKLNNADSSIQQCYKLLNYHLTDSVRKRKYSVCSSLGKVFSSFAGIKEVKTEENEFLFSEDTMKKMKSDLKKIQVHGSKNVRGSGKTSRGHFQGHSNFNNQNNNNNNHNSNHNNGYQSSRGNFHNNNNRNRNNNNSNYRGRRGRR